MLRVLPTALYFLMLIVAVWFVIFAVLIFVPRMGTTVNPTFWLAAAKVAPIFLTRFGVPHYIRRQTTPFERSGYFTVLVVVTAGAFISGTFFEALYLWEMLNTVDQPLTFWDVLFAPFNARYAVSAGIGGLGFAATAAVTAAMASGIFMPLRIRLMLKSQLAQ